jgi:DNA-binding response OmpR family regulator
VYDSESKRKRKPAREPRPGGTGGFGLSILVVDDDENWLSSFASFLIGDGHSAFTARGGSEAVQFARRRRRENEPLDLSILDCNMPDLSGIETFHQLVVEIPAVVAIFVSGDPSESLEEEVRNAGGLALVPKPVNLHRVRGLLADVFQVRRIRGGTARGKGRGHEKPHGVP